MVNYEPSFSFNLIGTVPIPGPHLNNRSLPQQLHDQRSANGGVRLDGTGYAIRGREEGNIYQ